jgi:RimJ/RimL family protein N-acetyltransferase
VDAEAEWLTKPNLLGSRVLLRAFEEQDIPAMGEALADPEVLIFTGSVHTSEEAHGRSPVPNQATADWYRTRRTAAHRLDLAIVDLATGGCVGEAVLNDYSPANASCNFRTLIGPRGRDRGLGSEATRLIVGYGITTLRLHRIELTVYAFNPRAQRVYEKAGFRVEGTARDALRFDGTWIDAICMSVLATDPEPGA